MDSLDPKDEIPVRPGSSARHLGLDGLRGLAMLLVLAQHFSMLGTGQGPLIEAVQGLAHLGFIGLDLFFVLSGFLITQILLGLRPSRAAYRSFYARRALRTVPLYAAVLLLVLHILPALLPQSFTATFWHREAHSPLWYWTFASNVAIALEGDFNHRWLSVTWSLAVEEQFYLFWPFLVFWAPRKKLGVICLALAFAAMALRTLLLLCGQSDEAIYVLTPCRLDALAMGGFIAVQAETRSFARIAQSLRRPGWIAALLAAAIAIWIYCDRPDERQRESFFLEDWRMQTLGYSAIAVASAFAVAMTAAATRKSWLESPLLVMVGRYSYAIYLFHMGAVIFTQSLVTKILFPGTALTANGDGLRPWPQLVFVLIAALVTFSAAALSWRWFEEKFMRWKDRFPYPKPDGDGRAPSAQQKDRSRPRERQEDC